MKKDTNQRRSFLKHLFAGSAAIAGSTLIGKKAQAKEGGQNNRLDEVLYKKTDAFKKYYDSLR
jgi:hypothetical protein